MSMTCRECEFFFTLPQDADDYEPGKGDCATQREDEKGKYWISRPAFEKNECCNSFSKR